MDAIQAMTFNLRETRRRSILLWRSLPDSWLTWRPDKDAMSFGEMIRHVWGASYGFHKIIQNNGYTELQPLPYDQEPIVSVENEITLSQPYFEAFIAYIQTISIDELDSRFIDLSQFNIERYAGDMLLRIAYHEAVHTGQFLNYMRVAGLERPHIWD
ncbi:DinB family protein [Longirhabdus pacifica]|uniref:DinB family protein n=1 Tax=Longirhabdus pacifica TaxID=2305227 RepID=UPI0010087513|nr:DinB family protein [Longirhabdus pacifica]